MVAAPRGEQFTSEGWSGTPYPFEVALQFPGAWDAGFVRELVLDQQLWGLRDASSELIGCGHDDIPGQRSGARAGLNDDASVIVVHAPEPFRLTLTNTEQIDLSRYDVRIWNLATRRPDRVGVTVLDEGLRIEQPDFLADALHVLRRQVSR